MGLFKRVIISLAIVAGLPFLLHAESSANDRPYKKELITFIALLNEYVESVGDGNSSLSPETTARLKELSVSIANFYFDKANADSALGEQLLSAFAVAVTENPDLNEEFVFLGNAFVAVATEIIKTKGNTNGETVITYKRTKTGAIIGLIAGIAIVVVSKGSAAGWVGGAAALGGATAIGFWLDRKGTSPVIRVDPRIQTAEAFNARFPSGQDLVNYRPPLALLKSVSASNGVPVLR